MLGFHLILRLGDDRVIAPSHAERLRVARQLARYAREFPILAWKLADTHLHVVLLGDASVVDELVRRLRIWFTNAVRPGVPLEVQRKKPIRSQSHLEAAIRYALGQDAHHGVETDRYQDASSVVDTLGLRVLCPEIAPRLRQHHPRLQREVLLRPLGVDALAEAVHLDHLAAAAAAAFGLPMPTLRGDGARARRAAVAAAAGHPLPAIARALAVTPQAAGRLAKQGAPPRAVRAVRLQMALRAALPVEADFAGERPLPAYG
ncbi:MAG: hypothetical protein ACOZNI_05510 [Myxococcota bacterium]